MTIYANSRQSRSEQGQKDGEFVLLETDAIIYSVMLEENADNYGLRLEDLKKSFCLIQQDWKTGET